MKRYIRSNSNMGTYEGIQWGMEDDHDMRYYFIDKIGKPHYADTEDELFSDIDEYVESQKYIRATTDVVNEKSIEKELNYAENIIKSECELRGEDEYVDDVKWGKSSFEIPIFKAIKPLHEELVNKFRFSYDELDYEEYGLTLSDQVDEKLNEFLAEWDEPAPAYV